MADSRSRQNVYYYIVYMSTNYSARGGGRISVFEPPLSETPSPKPQAPEKFQNSNTEPQNQMPGQTARRSVFELGAWSLVLGAWCLELGNWELFAGVSASQKLRWPDCGP